MDRREFVKFIALLSAGAAALPEQVAAFEKYYDVNTPPGAGPFLFVDDMMFSGKATHSTRILIRAGRPSADLQMAMNAFGGILHWGAAPMQAIVARPHEFTWEIGCPDYDEVNDSWLRNTIVAQISYIDYYGLRVNKEILTLRGSLP